MILYLCTAFTAGPNIKWDVLHALRICTGRYPHGIGCLRTIYSSEGQRGAAHVAGAALVAAAEAEQAVKPAGGGVVSRQRTDETHGTA